MQTLSPDRQAKLATIAQRTGRSTDELLQEAVDQFVEYNAWLEEKVGASIEQADSGQVLSTEQLRQRIGEVFKKHS